MDIQLLVDAHATIAEQPTWSPDEQALYWMDIKGPSLHRRRADGGADQWLFPDDVGGFAFTADRAAAVVALRNGIHRLDLRTGALLLLAPPPFDPALFRFNEGTCDAVGRFWIGTMFDPRPGVEAPVRKGALHRFTLAGGLERVRDAAELHNGTAWSADSRSLFLSHSDQGTIFRFDYELETGRLGERHAFATVSPSLGIPDGAAMDAEGCYWCAVHGGGRLHRYDGRGTLVDTVLLPVSQPTMCAFTGPALDEMVVSSASDTLSPEQRAAEPHAGGLFRFRPGVRGIPRPATVR